MAAPKTLWTTLTQRGAAQNQTLLRILVQLVEWLHPPFPKALQPCLVLPKLQKVTRGHGFGTQRNVIITHRLPCLTDSRAFCFDEDLTRLDCGRGLLLTVHEWEVRLVYTATLPAPYTTSHTSPLSLNLMADGRGHGCNSAPTGRYSG